MARVLIAGCGYVGSALAEWLVVDTHRVWGLRRRPVAMPLGVQPIVADLSDARTLKELPDGLDTVIYAVSPGGADDPHYRAACVIGVQELLEALARGGQRLQRFILVSSTSVYGQSGGEWVDETSATDPTGFSGRRLLEGERLLLSSGVPATVVRFGGIYGPQRSRLVESVRTGRVSYRARPVQWTNRIHRDDCAGVLRHLMGLESPEEIYLGVDSEPATQQAVMTWIAGALGSPPPRRADREPRDKRRSRSNKRVRNQRLLDSGYEFRYPSYREGYTAVLTDLL
jgi:nucleoside-diphosphate-sugar epimerase